MTMQTVYLTLQGDHKISIFSLNSESAELTYREDFAISGGPAPFAMSLDGSHAYVGLRDDFKMASLSVDATTGSLSLEGTIDLESDPCMISVDNNDNFLLSAYYGAGHIAVHEIDDSGKLVQEPIEWIATRHRAHCAITDASNSYTFLPHVDDSNSIYQYKFDSNTGKLTPNDPPIIEPPAGDGPRHYVYHPNGEFVYFDNEQGCSVTAYSFDKTSGTLEPIHTVSTLPNGWSGENTCAQIHIHPNGKFLYASNRGHDSIAIFAIDESTGRIESLGQQRTLGTPRAFNINPTGDIMLVGGLDDGELATYRLSPETGMLSHAGTQAVGDQPMWIHIVE